MTDNLVDLWNQTLTLASLRFPNPSFIQSWLKDTRPQEYKNSTLTITCPTEFAKAWIESKYKEILASAWKEVSGQPCSLAFAVKSQAQLIPGSLFPTDSQDSMAVKKKPREQTRDDLRLNPRYVFENFIVGASNRFAHAAALAVAESPSKIYNPLFIYGGVGLGKTHLMQAIAHYTLGHHRDLKVSYVSSETFTNDLILAIQEGRTQNFRNRYRNVDLLLIDDIQFVAGKDATQEEFFHTFDALHQASKQIIISSDRSPKEIATLEDRLRTRFEWGLTCDIQPPDLETRIAILRKKAELEGRNVPFEVCQYIAEKIPSNIRELEGALIRVLAYTSLQKCEVTLPIAQDVLKDILPEKKEVPLTMDLIMQKVAEFYQLDVEDFTAKRRTRSVAFPRQVAMYLCRSLLDASLPQIGQKFGGRDHTTVLHACAKLEEEKAHDKSLDDILTKLTKRIREGS